MSVPYLCIPFICLTSFPNWFKHEQNQMMKVGQNSGIRVGVTGQCTLSASLPVDAHTQYAIRYNMIRIEYYTKNFVHSLLIFLGAHFRFAKCQFWYWANLSNLFFPKLFYPTIFVLKLKIIFCMGISVTLCNSGWAQFPQRFNINLYQLPRISNSCSSCCYCNSSQKASHGDISGTKRGIKAPLVSKLP